MADGFWRSHPGLDAWMKMECAKFLVFVVLPWCYGTRMTVVEVAACPVCNGAVHAALCTGSDAQLGACHSHSCTDAAALHHDEPVKEPNQACCAAACLLHVARCASLAC
jgi:hypothetical protein